MYVLAVNPAKVYCRFLFGGNFFTINLMQSRRKDCEIESGKISVLTN